MNRQNNVLQLTSTSKKTLRDWFDKVNDYTAKDTFFQRQNERTTNIMKGYMLIAQLQNLTFLAQVSNIAQEIN